MNSLIRVSGLVLGVLTLLAAALFLLFDRHDAALGATLAAGALLLIASHRGSSSGVYLIAFALMAGALLVFGHVVLAALFAAFVVLLVALTLLVARQTARKLGAVELERVGPGVVMPKAEDAVAEFEALDFRRVGGYQGRFGRHLIVVAVMTGPEADRYAGVTDRVVEVVSTFGDRALVTVNSAVSRVPDDVLRQVVRDAEPRELDAAHQAALDLLAARGLRPDRFGTDAEVLDVAQALDEAAIRANVATPLKDALAREFRRAPDESPLGDDDRSHGRIEAWLATGASPDLVPAEAG